MLNLRESLKEFLTTIKFDFKAISVIEIWCADDPRNQNLFNLENYISVNQVNKHGRGGDRYVFIYNSRTFKLRSDSATNSNGIESLNIKIENKRNRKCYH